MTALRFISADSHVIEPVEMFDRLDRTFADRAPRLVVNDQGVVSVVTEGIRPWYPGVVAAAGRIGESLDDALRMGYEALRPSGWDPDARIADQEADGVAAEVLYASFGRWLFLLEDLSFRQACLHAYNDWLAEFCSAHPDRLIGVSLIDLEDVAAGVAELERCADLGLRTAGIWSAAPEDRPYSSPIYEPLWRVASALEIPLAMHSGSGASAQARALHATVTNAINKTAPARLDVSMSAVPIQQTFQDLILGGVLERHPALKVGSVEHNIGWIPFFFQELDRAHERSLLNTETPLSLKPSEYFRRQMFATFEDDPFGAKNSPLLGEETYMWASDFPHPMATWPHSHKVVERDFAGVPAAIVRKIVRDNAAALYGINVDE